MMLELDPDDPGTPAARPSMTAERLAAIRERYRGHEVIAMLLAEVARLRAAGDALAGAANEAVDAFYALDYQDWIARIIASTNTALATWRAATGDAPSEGRRHDRRPDVGRQRPRVPRRIPRSLSADHGATVRLIPPPTHGGPPMASDPPHSLGRTVYVVTSGEYSDYCIRAIFSARDGAEAYAAELCGCRGYDSVEVEEYTLDAAIGMRRITPHVATIRLDTGEIVEVEERCAQMMDRDGPCEVSGPWPGPGPAGRRKILEVYSPISADHAIKVAVEKRQEWLRTQARADAGDVAG